MTTNPADRLAELLHQELRSAGSAAMDSGATAEEVTADLTERLHRLRRLNKEVWAGPTEGESPEE
jgi:hypothetical protein